MMTKTVGESIRSEINKRLKDLSSPFRVDFDFCRHYPNRIDIGFIALSSPELEWALLGRDHRSLYSILREAVTQCESGHTLSIAPTIIEAAMEVHRLLVELLADIERLSTPTVNAKIIGIYYELIRSSHPKTKESFGYFQEKWNVRQERRLCYPSRVGQQIIGGNQEIREQYTDTASGRRIVDQYVVNIDGGVGVYKTWEQEQKEKRELAEHMAKVRAEEEEQRLLLSLLNKYGIPDEYDLDCYMNEEEDY